VLWAAGLIAILSIAHAVLGIAIWAVVLTNASSHSGRSAAPTGHDSAQALLPAHARVVRDGQNRNPASDVVVAICLSLRKAINSG